MILAKDAVIAGHPVRAIQAALREIGRKPFETRDGFIETQRRKVLRLKRDAMAIAAVDQSARTLWDALLAHGLLEPSSDAQPSNEAFHLSAPARSIRNATIGAGYKRRSAEQVVNGFVERCRQLDEPESIYPYRVGLAVLFGSYAAGKDIVGDVDILVKLEPRYRNEDRNRASIKQFIKHMERQGRSIPWDADLFWPYSQTLVFLRNRSRILALLQLDNPHLEMARRGPHRILYGEL